MALGVETYAEQLLGKAFSIYDVEPFPSRPGITGPGKRWHIDLGDTAGLGDDPAPPAGQPFYNPRMAIATVEYDGGEGWTVGLEPYRGGESPVGTKACLPASLKEAVLPRPGPGWTDAINAALNQIHKALHDEGWRDCWCDGCLDDPGLGHDPAQLSGLKRLAAIKQCCSRGRGSYFTEPTT